MEEDIGHTRARKGGEGTGGILEEGGGQEGMTLRAAMEAEWLRRRSRIRGIRVGMSRIWDRGRENGGHTVANVTSKGQSLILP